MEGRGAWNPGGGIEGRIKVPTILKREPAVKRLLGMVGCGELRVKVTTNQI